MYSGNCFSWQVQAISIYKLTGVQTCILEYEHLLYVTSVTHIWLTIIRTYIHLQTHTH